MSTRGQHRPDPALDPEQVQTDSTEDLLPEAYRSPGVPAQKPLLANPCTPSIWC